MTKTFTNAYVHPIAPDALNDTLAAEHYDAMRHAPRNFQLELTYLHFRHETLAQYADIIAGGISPIWDDGSREYRCSAEMIADADAGAILTRLTVASGDADAMPEDHPMLARVDDYAPGLVGLRLNDVFRFVHDVNGHWGGRDAQHHSFGPNGERNAWLRHRNLYSRAALLALWCETRGQSSWVNAFGDHAELPQSQRPFAAQKSGMVPSWLI